MQKQQQTVSCKLTSNSCLRSANLLEAGFLKHQGVSQRAQSAQQAMPTACSFPGQLTSGPQSRGWGLWAQPWPERTAGWVSALRVFLDRAPGQAPARAGFCTAASQKNYPVHPPWMFSGYVRSESYLRFLSSAWKFDSHGEAVPDWNRGCDPVGFLV